MKNISKIIFSFIVLFHSKVLYANDDAGILGWWLDQSCLTGVQIRTWDIHLDDVPCVIKGMIDVFMSFAATIAVIFIIIGWYQVLYWSLEGNKTKGKETIMMALWWFALAAFSWVIIRFILDNFS